MRVVKNLTAENVRRWKNAENASSKKVNRGKMRAGEKLTAEEICGESEVNFPTRALFRGTARISVGNPLLLIQQTRNLIENTACA